MSFHKNGRKAWKHEITGPDGNCMLFGVNIFDCEWSDTGEKVMVTDPQYHHMYSFSVYTVDINGSVKRFAAGEFSNCVWGFYLNVAGGQ